MHHIKITLFLGFLVLLGGCAEIMNPYEEEFGCPNGDFGSCDKVKDAYEKSFLENDESFSPMVMVKINKNVEISADYSTPRSGDNEDRRSIVFARSDKGEIYDHQKSLLTELQGIISDEETPMLLPSKQMRLLVLGYEDDNNTFYSHRYMYFIAEDQRWILPTNRIGIPRQQSESLFK